MTYVNAKLPNRVIAITKGADLVFSVRRRDALGAQVDWDADVYTQVDVSRTSPTRVNATVSGSLATIRLESTLLDTIKNGTTWRVIMSQDGVPRLETAVMVGVFERNDGR